MPQPLYPWGKSPQYPLDRMLGGPRVVLGAVVKRKIHPPGIEPRSSSPYPSVYIYNTGKKKLKMFFCMYKITNLSFMNNVKQFITQHKT